MTKQLSPKQIEKREKILSTAIFLFAQKGFQSTTVQDIAKEAGVSFGTVFTYFENKEALFNATITEPLEKFERAFAQLENDDRPIIDQLKTLIRKHVELVAINRNYLQLIQQVLGQPAIFEELMDNVDQSSLRMCESIMALIEKGIVNKELEDKDPMLTSTFYLSFIIGTCLTTTERRYQEIKEFIPEQALKLFSPLPKGE